MIGFTVITAEPVWFWLHAKEPGAATLTNAYVVVVDNAGVVIVAFPEPFKTIV